MMADNTDQDNFYDLVSRDLDSSDAALEGDSLVFSNYPVEAVNQENSVSLDNYLAFIYQIVSDRPEIRRLRMKPSRGNILDWYSLDHRAGLCVNRINNTEMGMSSRISAAGWCVLRVRLSGSVDEILGRENPLWEGTNSSFICLDEQFDYEFQGVRRVPMRSISLIFKPEWLKSHLKSNHPEVLKLFEQSHSGGEAKAHFFPVHVGLELTAVTQRLVDHFRQTSLQPLLVEAMVLELLAHALTGLKQEQKQGRKSVLLRESDIQQLERVKARLDEEFVQRPGLEELSRWAGSNRSKLSAGFRALYGSSIGDYCLKNSLALAQTLLKEGERVGDVALSVGYEHQGSFTKAFKLAFGVTPSAYRKTG